MKIYNYKDRLARFGYKYFDTILKNLEIIKISEKAHDFSRESMSKSGKKQKELVMNKELTDVTVILDRSGSMVSCRKEAESGLNEFVNKQKREPGECNFTLVQFDDEYEVVCEGQNIKTLKRKFKLKPRGMTALFDAIGKTINSINIRLSDLTEEERPGAVVVVILTDGMNNVTKEFTKHDIKRMIEHQQNGHSWKFTYLGANQDAFAAAGEIGVAKYATANYNVAKLGEAFEVVSNKLSEVRMASSLGKSFDFSYSSKDRKNINN